MPPPNSPSSDALIVQLGTKVDILVRDQGQTNTVLADLTRAVQKLAVIEERQTNDRAATERAFGELKSQDLRIKRLEDSQPANTLTNNIVIKVVGLVVAAVAGANISSVLRPAPAPSVMIQNPVTAPVAPARP